MYTHEEFARQLDVLEQKLDALRKRNETKQTKLTGETLGHYDAASFFYRTIEQGLSFCARSGSSGPGWRDAIEIQLRRAQRAISRIEEQLETTLPVKN